MICTMVVGMCFSSYLLKQIPDYASKRSNLKNILGAMSWPHKQTTLSTG